jgi:hypothetical protein
VVHAGATLVVVKVESTAAADAGGGGATDSAGRWGRGGTPSGAWEEHCQMELPQPSSSLLPCGCESHRLL